MIKTVLLVLVTLLVMSGCGEKDEKRSRSLPSGMKCGAGKCGANMLEGNAALIRKKKNILSQMHKDDPRKECVIKAETTKMAYDCVRDPSTGKLTVTSTKQKTPVKCGAQKCGGKM